MLRVPWKSASAEETPPETPVDDEPTGRPGWVRWLALALVLVVLGAAGYFAYRQFFAPKTTVAAVQTFTARKGNIVSTVAATGTVSIQNQSRLSFPSSSASGNSAVVTALNVNVGDAVKKGQVLATLDSSQLQLAVTQAQASLASAQSKLATIKAGALPTDVAAAQAAVANAQANLDSVKAPPAAADISAAQQAVASAMSQVQSTRSALTKLKQGATAQDIRNAQIAISQAQISLRNAQLNANTACTFTPTGGGTNNQGTPVPTSTPGPSFYNGCAAARNSVTNASYQVSVAQNNLAKLQTPATAADVAAAQQSVTAAENNYNAAVAKLNTLKAGATDAQLASAQSQLAQAQANLAKAQTPYTDADVQSAQAAVDQAQAALDTAEGNLQTATLRAPFDGVISAINVNVGEAPASPAMTIVDPNNLRLDTSVDESDITKIQLGQTVNVSFDAVPNATFQGKVTSIAPIATIQSGVALYTVQVAINPTPITFSGTGSASPSGTGTGTGTGRTFTGTPGANATPGANGNRRASATPAAGATPAANSAPAAGTISTPLKAGMTGNATIVYGDAQNVLVVPNNAIKTQGRNKVVQLMVDGKPQATTVTTGASNDQYTEITSGLAEGDQVVVTGTTATSGRVGTGAAIGGFGGGGFGGGGFGGR